jgi:hypothetical protein
MPEPTCFLINQPQVISQTIDDEAVVINLLTGTYYSLTGSAGAIWRAVEMGLSNAEIPAWLESQFVNCGTDLAKITADFLAELQAESLIYAGVKNVPSEMPPAATKRAVFSPPTFKKFTDMQEMLLLDPIHEVDATGWPQVKPGDAKP